MSRFGMGFGKDGKLCVDNRPCIRVHSSRCQVVLNKWFGTTNQAHPDWMTTEFKSPPRANPDQKGEWQLVWHAKSRPNTVTVPTRKVLVTLKDDEEKTKLKARLAHELGGIDFSTMQKGVQRDSTSHSQRSQHSHGGDLQSPMRSLQRDQLASQASNRSRLPSTRGSQRALSTAGSVLRERPASSLSGLREDDANQLVDGDRMGTSYSHPSRVSKASRRSRSSLGTSSTLTRNSEELLTRIKGLEEALLQVSFSLARSCACSKEICRGVCFVL